jgi:hypothetical protein
MVVNIDELVKTLIFIFSVIPAKVGIKLFQGVPDPGACPGHYLSGVRRGDGLKGFLRLHQYSGRLTFFQISKVFFPAHASRSQETGDYVHVDRIVGRDDNGTLYSRLDIYPMGPVLPVECEPERQKNALHLFPMNRIYAWHTCR